MASASTILANVRAAPSSPAIFCYDLMNEPVAPAGKRPGADWLGPAFAGKHFVQFIALDAGERKPVEIARQWIRQLVTAIRKDDRRHLVTAGLVPWSLDCPGLKSGFEADKVVGELDFISVHLYPASGKVAEGLETLRAFRIGKPLLIEEMFPLNCSLED